MAAKSKKKSEKGSPLAFIEKRELSSYAVYPFLNKSRLIRPGEPEERVRLALYNELLERYAYPPELIEIEFPVIIRDDEQPRFADIVVFTDEDHKRPYIVVEAKKPKREDGERQGQRYATILRAVYVLWSNGDQRSTSVIVNRYPEDASPIADIPRFEGELLSAIEELTPFKDDKHIGDAFKRCHSLIRNLSHLKADDAFAEFLKILLVKFQDEAQGGDYEFQILLKGDPSKPEPANETAQRIRQMFKAAVDEDSEISSVFQQGDDITLTNECIADLVAELQRYSFAQTPVDQKGRAFEAFISGDMRQEFKEFMTPRIVVESMIQMADPDASTNVLDPCCGSGAFLIYALKHVRDKIEKRAGYNERQKVKSAYDFAHDKLWGLDASKQMSAVARINMLVNDDGRSHIFTSDALNPRGLSPDQIRTRQFKLILTNPPFGKSVKATSAVAQHFDLAKDDSGRQRTKGSLPTEVLFIERNLEWLSAGGKMFIVLPDSVLGNSTLAMAREYVERHARLLALVSLSSDTFGPSGAKSKTSFLIFEKRSQPLELDEFDDYPVFIGEAINVGYDFTGRATGKNDLPTVVADYKHFQKTGETKSGLCRVVQRKDLGSTWLAQSRQASTGGDTLLMSFLCEDIKTGKTAPRSEYVASGYHLVKVGNLTGRGIEWEAVERQFVTKKFADHHARAALKPGDILFTAAAHGPKWIGLKVDIFTGVPKHLQSTALYCGEIMRLRLKKDCGLDPYYVLLFLRSNAGYAEIQRCIRGQSGHVYREEVGDIEVPNPAKFDPAVMKAAIEALKQAEKFRGDAIAQEKAALSSANKIFGSAAPKPIIAT